MSMYLPTAFREDDPVALHAFIRAHPLALLITGGSDDLPLQASHVPCLLDPSRGARGTLRAHLARANPQTQALRDGAPCLLVFTGPQAYISPGWYATKQESGKVVPTWNYSTVQARGLLRRIDDPAGVLDIVSALTDTHEAAMPQPWAASDAPEDFLQAQLRAIVGLEVPIDSLQGKFKLSQNRPLADRQGVVRGLAPGDAQQQAVGRMVAERLPPG